MRAELFDFQKIYKAEGYSEKIFTKLTESLGYKSWRILRESKDQIKTLEFFNEKEGMRIHGDEILVIFENEGQYDWMKFKDPENVKNIERMVDLINLQAEVIEKIG